MGTHRIEYLIAVAFSAIFCAVYPLWFSRYLFVLVLLLMPFDLLISLPGLVSRRAVSLTAPRTLEQGAYGTVIFSIKPSNKLPVGFVKVRLYTRADGKTFRSRFICSGAPSGKYEAEINTSHSGVIAFEINRLWLTSLLGLFSIPASVRCRTAVLVLPPPVKPPRAVWLPRANALRPKPGGGFSEEHDLRAYRRGDPMKSVHWKLSAKRDSLIIREALSPVPHSRLVKITPWSGPFDRDLILGRLLWVSGWLLKRDMPHYVRLGSGPLGEVTRDGDLAGYLLKTLDDGGEAPPAPVSPPARFTWVFRVDSRGAQR